MSEDRAKDRGDDLVDELLGRLSEEDSSNLRAAMARDSELASEYRELAEIVRNGRALGKPPSQTSDVVQRVMNAIHQEEVKQKWWSSFADSSIFQPTAFVAAFGAIISVYMSPALVRWPFEIFASGKPKIPGVVLMGLCGLLSMTLSVLAAVKKDKVYGVLAMFFFTLGAIFFIGWSLDTGWFDEFTLFILAVATT